MKIYRNLFIFLLLSTTSIHAQSDFRPGYIINNQGDTVSGLIDYRNDVLMSQTCKFRPSGSGQEISYAPEGIFGYRFENNKYFVSKDVKGKKKFLEFLIYGQISIYYNKDEMGDHYYIEKTGVGLTQLTYNEGYIFDGDKQYEKKSTTHLGVLRFYMQDAPEFQPQIDELKTPSRQNLIKLAENYHHKICKDKSCIIYEKKVPWIGLKLEVIGGVAFLSNTFVPNNINCFQPGIIAHVCMTSLNEKLYFRTGLVAFELKSNTNLNLKYKIPIQLEYIFPKGTIRPKIAAGISIYKAFYQSVSVMGGVDIKLVKSFYLSICDDIDFSPMESVPVIPSEFISHALSVGLVIDL